MDQNNNNSQPHMDENALHQLQDLMGLQHAESSHEHTQRQHDIVSELARTPHGNAPQHSRLTLGPSQGGNGGWSSAMRSNQDGYSNNSSNNKSNNNINNLNEQHPNFHGNSNHNNNNNQEKYQPNHHPNNNHNNNCHPNNNHHEGNNESHCPKSNNNNHQENFQSNNRPCNNHNNNSHQGNNQPHYPNSNHQHHNNNNNNNSIRSDQLVTEFVALGGEGTQQDNLTMLRNAMHADHDEIVIVGNWVYILLAISALPIMGISFYKLLIDADFHNFFYHLIETTDSSLAALWMLSSWGPLTGGLVVMSTSLIALRVNNWSDERAKRFDDWAVEGSGCLASCVRDRHSVKRLTFHTHTIIVGLAVMIQIVAGGVFVFLVDQLESTVETSSSFGADESVFDFTAAIFNQCCAQRGWTRQGEIPSCSSPEATICELPSALSSYKDDLCFCYSDEEAYEAGLRFVDSNDVCPLLEGTHVQFRDSDIIPGTPLPIRFFTSSLNVPVVGPVETNGCGLGLARGFQWVTFKWFSQKSNSIALATLIISCLQAALLMVSICQHCIVSDEAYFDNIIIEGAQAEMNKAGKQTPRSQRRLRRAIGVKTPKWKIGSGTWSIPSPYRGLNAAARSNQKYKKGLYSTRVQVQQEATSGLREIKVEPIHL